MGSWIKKGNRQKSDRAIWVCATEQQLVKNITGKHKGKVNNEILNHRGRLTRGQVSNGLDWLKVGLYVQFNLEFLVDDLGYRKAQAQEERQTIPIRF